MKNDLSFKLMVITVILWLLFLAGVVHIIFPLIGNVLQILYLIYTINPDFFKGDN